MYLVISDDMPILSSINIHPAYVRWAWLAILSKARAGIIKDLTPYTLSKLASISVSEAAEAVMILSEPDPYSKNKKHDGRRLIPTGEPNEYELVSWDEYSTLLAKAHAAKRAKDYRAEKSRQKGRSVRKKATPEATTPGFLEFWDAYPRRVAKEKALESWQSAIKAGAQVADILAGAKRYAAERAGEDPKFTAYPATWLNQRRWEDGGEKKGGSDVSWS